MKREIKFRAWDEETKTMLDDCADGVMIQMNSGRVGEYDDDGNFVDEFYPLMQFTGLHDKNGKEIYEGDIVQWDDTIDDGYGCGYLTTIREVVTFGGGAYNPTSTMPSKYFEVIGNIYENSDLLKA